MDRRGFSIKARHVATATTAATGVFLLFLPAPERSLSEQNKDETAAAPAPRIAPTVTVEELKLLFSLTDLPKRAAPEPSPVDPSAAIGRYRLLGVTMNDDEALALIADGNTQLTLRQGDMLAEFVVTRIRPRQVEFEKEGIAASLRLAGMTRRDSSDQ